MATGIDHHDNACCEVAAATKAMLHVAVLLLLDTGRPTMAVALSAALQLRKAVVSPWDRHRALLDLFCHVPTVVCQRFGL